LISRQHHDWRRSDAAKQREGKMPGSWLGCRVAAASVLALAFASGAAMAQIMIIGNDQKPKLADGKTVIQPPGHDTLSIIDMSKPAALSIVATIPLDNTIAGPPTNLAITPSRDIALVACSQKGEAKDNGFVTVPDDRLFVVDLKASPPAVTATVTLGKSPSGLAISADGKLALVANRGDGTVSVLSMAGKDVKVTDTVTVGAAGDAVAAIAIAPDGKQALAVKSAVNKVAVLTIDGGKVSYDKNNDLPANFYPYNVAITPNGKIALVANTGNGGSSDGHADTVSVIDLEAKPIRVIDHVTVGDSPEGLVISPKGDVAVTVDARGSNRPKDTWYYHPGGAVTVLKIDGKKVTNVGEATVGGLPEGAVFSADGSFLYVGNFIDSDLSIFQVDGAKLTDKGRMKLPGQPASMRGGPQ
jgi:DNA-binding beta-propeller fold protein YncE